MKKDITLFNSKNTREDEVNRYLELLFKPHKTIRDAVHGDVMLTDLEVRILDTTSFQRLHGIRQLGTTHLVYPCAKHSRFEHAIGCLFMTEKILTIVNTNPYRDLLVNSHDRLLLRLSALLHDLAHVPYGHTLEDEGNLFKSQWKDEKRFTHYLGEKSEIAEILLNYEILKELHKLGRSEFEPATVLKNLRDILIAMENHKVEELPKPYLCDIIGNTLCADLLDYVRRDIYFTGLREDYDERFLSYLYITKYSSKPKEVQPKPRLVLRLIKPKTGRMRRDVLSELLHLLRLRYSLAEKVYYHHAKISSSAMIISAVTDILQIKIVEEETFYSMLDDTLVEFIKEKGTECAKYLMEKLTNRQLYKPVYGLKYGGEMLEVPHAKEKKALINDLRQKELRWRAERALEIMNRLKQGSIVVYCPGKEMGYKAVEVLVNVGDERIGPLDKIAPERVKEEIESSITKKHLELWTMYVFADRNLTNDIKSNIQGDCERMFNLQNEIEECSKYKNSDHLPYLIRWEDKYIEQHPSEKRLDSREVLQIAARPTAHLPSEAEAKYMATSYEEYCKMRNQK